jgi:hypothetical protein
MMSFLLSSCRVALGFALGTLFGWGLGQLLQDVCAPNVIRPTLNAPDQVAAFLKQLPPIAHASRLLANGAGMFLGLLLLRRRGDPRKPESHALAALFLTASIIDVVRVPHGLTLSVLTLATSLAAVWMGLGFRSRRR